MRKFLLILLITALSKLSFSQKDTVLYSIDFFYLGTTYTSIHITKYDTGFTYISNPVTIPTCNWGCGIDYTAYDRKHNMIFINYGTLYFVDLNTNTYLNMPTSNISNYAFNCRDSTMYCARQVDSISKRFFYLMKIFPMNNKLISGPKTPFYTGQKIYSPTIDEKNNRFCFLDSTYKVISVSLTSGHVTSSLNTNLMSGQTNYGLRYNPNDSLLYTIFTDASSNKAFLRSINVNTGAVFTHTTDINVTGFLPSYGNVNQNVDIDFSNNTFYFTQCDCNIMNPANNVVFNKVNINSGQIAKTSHLMSYSKHSYVGLLFGQSGHCNFTGVDEFETTVPPVLDTNVEISLVPNPTYDQVYLQNLKSGYMSSIVDNLGRSILEKDVDQGNNSIDVSSLAAGIYYLKVGTQSSTFKTFKLIKQ